MGANARATLESRFPARPFARWDVVVERASSTAAAPIATKRP
jgi:hypothetical protein